MRRLFGVDHYTVSEVAECLGRSEKVIRQRIQQGKLKALFFEHKYYVSPENLVKIINKAAYHGLDPRRGRLIPVVVHPISKLPIEVDVTDLTQKELDQMTVRMDDDARHFINDNKNPRSPGEWFVYYVEVAGSIKGGIAAVGVPRKWRNHER